MGRDEFILTLSKIEGIPFLPVPSSADPWTPPKTIVFCLGHHGSHVWTLLTALQYPPSIYPIVVRRADVVGKTRWIVQPEESVVVSGLADDILDGTLRQFEMEEELGSRSLDAILIYPYSCEGARRKRIADDNLKRMERLGWNVTIINPLTKRMAEIEAMGREIDVREAWVEDERRIVETILNEAKNR